MRITLAAIGRLKDGPDRALFDRYWQRLDAGGRKIAFHPLRLIELPESRAQTAPARKADEAARLDQASASRDFTIALDESGRQLTSPAFAALLARHRDAGVRELALLIGGPDGHGAGILERADFLLGLGAMTLPHGLARIVLAEQLYRASTILTGHAYHRA